MRILTLILILFGVSVLAMDEKAVAQLLHEAEQLFASGNEAQNKSDATELWRKSAARYELAIREGNLSNGPVFYNLGNVYYRLGDMGRSILNYRRAMRFMPNDKNLLTNLEYARRSRQDAIEEQESRKVLKTLLFWHYDFSLATRELVFIICFCAIWLIAALMKFWRAAFLKVALFCSFFVAFVMAASMVTTEVLEHKFKDGVIVADECVGRKGNSRSYESSFKEPLHAGTEFVVLEQRDNWLEIRLANGMTTWISETDAELL